MRLHGNDLLVSDAIWLLVLEECPAHDMRQRAKALMLTRIAHELGCTTSSMSGLSRISNFFNGRSGAVYRV
jgi:hypothetical protein